MFGQPGLLAHGDEAEVAHRVLEPQVRRVGAEGRAQPVGLPLGDLQPLGHAGLRQAALQPDRNAVVHGSGLPHRATGRRDDLAGALAAAERRQVVGSVPPHDVAPVDLGVADLQAAPEGGGPGGHRVGDLADADVDALVGQRGHPLVGDAARHDVAPVPHVGRHVEGEAVHRPPAGEAHADRRDLARVVALGVDPHPGVLPQAPRSGQADVGERVDQQLLDRPHVGHGVGEPVLPLPRFAGSETIG